MSFGETGLIRKNLLRILFYSIITFGGGDNLAKDGEIISEDKDDVMARIRADLSFPRRAVGQGSEEGFAGGDAGVFAEGSTEGYTGGVTDIEPSTNGDNNVDNDNDTNDSSNSAGDTHSDTGDDNIGLPADAQEQAQVVTYEVTAYTAGTESTGKSPEDAGYGITASGEKVREGHTLACPQSLPFGTVVAIEGVGDRVCTDRGGAITEGRLDVYMPTLDDAIKFGRKTLEVTIK